MADHIGRGMPLVLVDSRERADPSPLSVDHAAQELVRMTERLHGSGVADWYSTSTLAYLKSVVDRQRRRAACSNNEDDQRRMWIFQAVRQQRSAEETKREADKMS